MVNVSAVPSLSDVIPVDILLPERWWDPTLYRLRETLTIDGIEVPRGSITDGATVPRWLWWLFPPIGKYFYAAVLHDHLLDIGVDWRVANRHFERVLIASNIPRWRRRLMVAAVNLWWALKSQFVS